MAVSSPSPHVAGGFEHALVVLGSPPRSIADLQYEGLEREQLLRVPGARVVFADYHLLTHDFPELPRDRARRRPALLPETGEPPSPRVSRAIDAWLLEHCAVLSARQARANDFNRAVKTAGQQVEAFRPLLYGRAAVIPAGGGLLDVKGIGVRPSATPIASGNGIYLLANLLKDSAMQWLCDAAFEQAGQAFRAVPLYAAIDLGVRDVHGHPLGVQVRRAHRRPFNGHDIPPPDSVESRLRLAIELLLRRFGITSCIRKPRMTLERKNGAILVGNPVDPSFSDAQRAEIGAMTNLPEGRFRLEAINVQLAGDPRETPSPHALVVDYQDFNVRRRFQLPLVNIVSGRPIGWGGALWPGDSDYVQPRQDPTPLGPWRRLREWSTELASRFDSGRADGKEILWAMREAVSQRAAAWREERAA